MMNTNKHPLDIINERLENGYYRKCQPYSYSRDLAFVNYMLGYCSKIDYEIAKSKYDMFNWEQTSIKKGDVL